MNSEYLWVVGLKPFFLLCTLQFSESLDFLKVRLHYLYIQKSNKPVFSWGKDLHMFLHVLLCHQGKFA